MRWPAIDIARGLAVIAMVVYHFAWDLSFLRLIATDVVGHPGWQLFARAIAASFLVLVGIGLVLAHGDRVHWRAFARRLIVIASAALAVTAATRLAFPDTYIFFGILHCIAASSVLALPFLRVPVPAVAAAAAACFAAPLVFTGSALDISALDWLGLGRQTPLTNDYVPIFPWFGFVLLGIGAARVYLPALGPAPAWPGHPGPARRALIWCGRHSLVLYLVHQPALLAVLFMLLQIAGPDPVAGGRTFTDSCKAGCAAKGVAQARCEAACRCTADALKAEGLWQRAVQDALGPEERERTSALAQQCFK